MVWFRVDDSFYDHPKVVSIPRSVRTEAIGTWTLAGVWCAKQLTDGVLPIHQVEEVGGTMAGALALVKAKLWTKTKTDFRFKSWAEYQPTRSQVESARDTERKRKADQRAKAKGQHTESRPDSDPSPNGSPAPVPPGVPVGQDRVSGHPVPSRPDPTHDSYVSPSSHVPERESYPQDDDENVNRSRRDAYWHGWGISNPLKIVSLLIEVVERPITEDQAVLIVAGILGKAKQRPTSIERYVLGAIRQSWAEIQQELDEAAVAA